MKTKSEMTAIKNIHKFIGYYKFPKEESVMLDSIGVYHMIDEVMHCECDFEIKKDGEDYILIPDVKNVDLMHSMNFAIIYDRKVYAEKIEIKSSDCLINGCSDFCIRL